MSATTETRTDEDKAPKRQAETPDPWKDPFNFLRLKGWKFRGNPHSPHSLWWLPSWPQKESQEKRKVPVYGTEIDNATDTRRTVVVREIEQVHVTQARPPVSREEAVQIQLELDADAKTAKK